MGEKSPWVFYVPWCTRGEGFGELNVSVSALISRPQIQFLCKPANTESNATGEQPARPAVLLTCLFLTYRLLDHGNN